MRLAADILPQGPINPDADAYALTCLRISAEIPRIPDIGFGPSPEQRLDLYLPQACAPSLGKRPIFLFWHGGGYTHGHKEWCGFMAPPLLAKGAIFISANYRLFPRATMTEVMADARAAVLWALRNAEAFGGDPQSLVIGGHSAGANIAARLALDKASRDESGIPDTALRAVMAMSGSYMQRRGESHPDPKARPLAQDPDAVTDFPYPAPCPFTLAWGTKERDPFPQSAEAFLRHLQGKGAQVTALPFAGDDHFSVHLGTKAPHNAFTLAALSAMGL